MFVDWMDYLLSRNCSSISYFLQFTDLLLADCDKSGGLYICTTGSARQWCKPL